MSGTALFFINCVHTISDISWKINVNINMICICVYMSNINMYMEMYIWGKSKAGSERCLTPEFQPQLCQ